MQYLFSAILGYLLGSSSMAYYIGLIKRKDIRTAGTGNLGASNMTVLFGWKAGILVALHDIGKAFLAVILAKLLFPQAEHAGAAAGVASVLGHIFPFYLNFKGGKGLASYFGMTLALNWKLALLVAAILVLATVITDFISVGAISTVLFVPAYTGIVYQDLLLAGILCVASIVMLIKHWENIVRIATHKEVGLRSTVKGEKRLDKK